MIIIVSWKSMINNLFQNNNEMICKVFIPRRILFDLIQEIVKGTCHHTWIFVTKCFFHLGINGLNRLNLVKLYQNHDCLFPDHLVLMFKKSEDCI